MPTFQVDDALIMTSPYDPEHPVRVIYRGSFRYGESVVYNPKTGYQGSVPDEWLTPAPKPEE